MTKRSASASLSGKNKRQASSKLPHAFLGPQSSSSRDSSPSGFESSSGSTALDPSREHSTSASSGHSSRPAQASTSSRTISKPPTPTTAVPKSASTAGRAQRMGTPVTLNEVVNNSIGLRGPQTARETSYDGTVILPSPTSLLQQTSLGTLVQRQSPDSFPVFKSGDVIIKTDLGHSPKTFQLHSSVLCRHSRFFAQAMHGTAPSDPPPSWYAFTIEEVDGKVRLVRQHTKEKRPNVSTKGPQMINGVEIKIEDISEEWGTNTAPSSTSTDTTVAIRKPRHTAAIACYTQILASFYNIPPQICTTNIGTALMQSEALIDIATELDCVQLLQAHLAKTYGDYRQKLHIAIKNDPPRWIQIALALENKSIYTECLIHMVGAHPKWPWMTSRKAVPESIQHVVKQKAAELDRLRTEIERDLLLINLMIKNNRDGQTYAPDPTQRTEIETWLTVQIVRDKIVFHMKKVEEHSESRLHWGTLYRGIFKGSLPWLETDTVREICLKMMKMEWKDLNEDMVKLREYAAKTVEKLAANELMIEPDANNVGYLTCVQVSDGDIPWLAGRV